jgi:transcriptional regulator with XRE-family HTH domain
MTARSTSRRPESASRAKPASTLDKIAAGRAVTAHVARRLKRLRLVKGRTQSEISAMLGISFQQVAKYERGLSTISPGVLWRLAKFLEVDVAYFFADLTRTPETGLTVRQARQQLAHRRMRLDVISALDNIADRTMLRSLLTLIQAYATKSPDQDQEQDG